MSGQPSAILARKQPGKTRRLSARIAIWYAPADILESNAKAILTQYVDFPSQTFNKKEHLQRHERTRELGRFPFRWPVANSAR